MEKFSEQELVDMEYQVVVNKVSGVDMEGHVLTSTL